VSNSTLVQSESHNGICKSDQRAFLTGLLESSQEPHWQVA
jgi:hypothetical protein